MCGGVYGLDYVNLDAMLVYRYIEKLMVVFIITSALCSFFIIAFPAKHKIESYLGQITYFV